MNGDFSLSKFDYLSIDEHEFIECYLKYQGNFTAIQNEKGMSYLATKKKLADILDKLKLTPQKPNEKSEIPMTVVKNVPIKNTDSLAVKRIKEKLNASEGMAAIPLYSGESCDIWFETEDRGLVSPKIPPTNQLGCCRKYENDSMFLLILKLV